MDRRTFLGSTAAAGGLLASAQVQQVFAQASGSDLTDPSTNTKSRTAFQKLIQTLGDIEKDYLSQAKGITTTQEIAEGHRFIMHLLQQALSQVFESDPNWPVLIRSVTPTMKLLGDNPDAVYSHAAIHDKGRYLITGNRADATYFSVSVQTKGDSKGYAGGIGTTINDTQIEFEKDGSFEIALSTDKPGHKNWLKLPKGAFDITARHYFEEKNSVAAQYGRHIPVVIQPMDDIPPPQPPSDASIAAGIERATAYIVGRTKTYDPTRLPAWVSLTPNAIPKPQKPGKMAYAAVDIAYAMSPYKLEKDEVLVIRGRWPKCRFANLVLWNRYQQTYDYAHRQVSLNRVQTQSDKEGNFTIVLAHKNPGLPNWIDTEGRTTGTMYWRFMLPEEEIVTPVAEVIKFSQL
jgi:hypothetical protein